MLIYNRLEMQYGSHPGFLPIKMMAYTEQGIGMCLRIQDLEVRQ